MCHRMVGKHRTKATKRANSDSTYNIENLNKNLAVKKTLQFCPLLDRLGVTPKFEYKIRKQKIKEKDSSPTKTFSQKKYEINTLSSAHKNSSPPKATTICPTPTIKLILVKTSGGSM